MTEARPEKSLPYRVNVVCPRSRVRRPTLFLYCLSDDEAVALAKRQRLFSLEIEIWQGMRLVARIKTAD